ncbi:MAG: Rad52/Rad22 family DNA repair protein [Gammaproteobacteria bacterium]|nr:Rad52/Rad22 family DNA repair protein [Gammaproteobacteria bacterium]
MNSAKTKGMALAYVNARDVLQRLNDVVGPSKWQRRYPWSDGKRIVCEIGINIDGEWIWKADGAGETDFEADKGAFSDAFKRAAVSWGVAEYLYHAPAKWYDIENKKFTKQADGQILNDFKTWELQYFGFRSKRQRDQYITNIHRYWAKEDFTALRQEWDELDDDQRRGLWWAFTPSQRADLTEMLKKTQEEVA